MSELAQTFRYSVTAGICLVLGMILIPLLSWWGLHYTIATTLAFGTVCVVGFFLHCFWTFDVDITLHSFFRYVSGLALNLPLTIALIAVGHDLAGLSIAVSAILASVILAAWNYLVVRWAVSHHSRRPSQ